MSVLLSSNSVVPRVDTVGGSYGLDYGMHRML